MFEVEPTTTKAHTTKVLGRCPLTYPFLNSSSVFTKLVICINELYHKILNGYEENLN